MGFDVVADSYNRFMGRYSEPLAARFADWLGIRAGQRALDVGAGPGALTAQLVDRLGVAQVRAVEPSAPLRQACAARFPGLDVRDATADAMPFADDEFDVTAASLVVHFMPDAVAGLAEMGRVTAPGGVVAATVWDFGGDRAPISPFWIAARALDPAATDENLLPGARAGSLAELIRDAGLRGVELTELRITVQHQTFEQWWEPFMLGVGPAGAYLGRLTEEQRDAVRERCRELLPPAPFEVAAVAWAARATP